MSISSIQSIVVSVDVVLFSIIEHKLSVFLVYRDNEPFGWSWALPWAPVKQSEEFDVTVSRMLYEKTWVKRVYAKQFGVFDALERDPRWRTISIAFYSLITCIQQDKWMLASLFFPIRMLPDLAFDHKHIILTAYDVLKSNVEKWGIENLLPKHFTLSELQQVYEIVFWFSMDVRNFRKKILSWASIAAMSWMKQKNWSKRPAQLYRFIKS